MHSRNVYEQYRDDLLDKLLWGEATTEIEDNEINHNGNLSNIKIFPNPVNNHITIDFYLQNAASIKINFFDNTGRVIYVEESKSFMKGENRISLKIPDLSNGIYNCVIIVDGKSTMTRRVIKL
ncbi:MAG: T9SS type A sorting domain-containing protein [Bacteroidota bacterium]|nr:T9SS type A sorting domain-containing protein [Bacteroidota bacterium]